MNDCAYCNNKPAYQIGATLYNRRTLNQVVGLVCTEHVGEGIQETMSNCFSTVFWPTVHSLDGNLLYHSYDADKEGLAAVAGWEALIAGLPF